jgi:hypothetical protein
MLASIVLSVLLHLPGQMERVDPHLIPGKIDVAYQEGVTSEQREAFEKSVGLPEPTGIPCVLCTYKVVEGHEKFWELVLKDSANVHIVASVEQARRPKSRAELLAEQASGPHREAQVALRFRSPFARFSVSLGEMLDAKINQYFLDKYAPIATVNVIKRGDHFIELSIDKMKGRVISEPHFWERLDIYVVFFYTKNEAKLYVDYDGYFATGIGSRPPPDESYSNMSERYGRELSRYADMTTTALVSYLKKGQ